MGVYSGFRLGMYYTMSARPCGAEVSFLRSEFLFAKALGSLPIYTAGS